MTGFFESIQNASNFLLGSALDPLLNLEPVLTLFIVAFVISIISVLIQKKFTDQTRLKQLKKDLKKLQEEIRKHRDDPKKQMKLNRKMFPMQGEMMKASLKPALWLMLPFLLVFLWLAAHFAFEPITPGEPFTVVAHTNQENVLLTLSAPEGVTLLTNQTINAITNQARWELSAERGLHSLTITANNESVQKDVLVTNTREYITPTQQYNTVIREVSVIHEKLTPFGNFSLFGWNPGWIAVYIFFSIIMSMAFRKWFDVA